MVNSSFNLKTEVDYCTNILIIDETGELGMALAEPLLETNYSVYFFTQESSSSFSHLHEKNNFHLIKSFSETELLSKIDYLFFFPAENHLDEKKKLISEGNFFWLTQKHFCKILVCCPKDLPEINQYQMLVREKGLNGRLVVFDCLFGPGIKTGMVAKLVSAGLTGNQAVFSESAQEKVHPLSARTLTKELINLIFTVRARGKVYFLQGEPIDLQNLAGLVQKFCPTLHFDYRQEGPAPKEEPEGWQPLKVAENLEEKIKETVSWFEKSFPAELPEGEEEIKLGRLAQEIMVTKQATEEPLERVDLNFLSSPEVKKEAALPKKKPLPAKKPAPFSRKIFFGIACFLLLFFLFFTFPLAFSGTLGLVAIKEVESSKKAVEEGNISQAVKKNTSAQKLLHQSRQLLLSTSPFYALIGLDKQIGTVNDVFLFFQNLNDSLKFSLLATQELFDWTGNFIKGEGSNRPETFASVKVNLALAYEQASLAQSSLPGLEAGFKFLRQTQKYELLKKYLPEAREILLKSQNLMGVLPKALGFSGRKTYLVLFENNAELRPTGGFIGSYALLDLENGKLIDFEVFDVYQADGQLKGHVEPPPKLKEYLGEASWYLRDANWDPDFAVSAQRAQWFLDKEMQVLADGTVAVTLAAAKNIVAALGELEVPDYQEKVNQDNLFQKAEYYSELGSFPGSTQKKDFLGSLSKALFEKVRLAKKKDLVNIGGAIFASLEQKEILLYFNDREAQAVAAGLNWSGGIRQYQPRSVLEAAFADYLFINEANVGINKANFFVQRKIDHQVSFDEKGRVEEKLTLTYENQSPSNNWPAGEYKNYLRIYLPKGTKVTSILVTDPKNPGLWLPFDLRLFEVGEEYGRSFFSFLLAVPVKTKRMIEIRYELAQKISLASKLNSYLLLLQKQPGAHPSTYTLSFNYPSNFVPVRVIPSAIVGNQQLLVEDKLIKDLIFQIDLAH